MSGPSIATVQRPEPPLFRGTPPHRRPCDTPRLGNLRGVVVGLIEPRNQHFPARTGRIITIHPSIHPFPPANGSSLGAKVAGHLGPPLSTHLQASCAKSPRLFCHFSRRPLCREMNSISGGGPSFIHCEGRCGGQEHRRWKSYLARLGRQWNSARQHSTCSMHIGNAAVGARPLQGM